VRKEDRKMTRMGFMQRSMIVVGLAVLGWGLLASGDKAWTAKELNYVYSSKKATNFFFLDLKDYYNQEARPENITNLGFSSWFSKEEIKVEGIPFRVKLTGKNILATSLEKVETLSVPINKRASNIFLFMGARFGKILRGEKHGEPMNSTDTPDDFLIQLLYEDGSEDKIFPKNLKAEACLFTDNLSLYSVTPRFYKEIRELKINDRMENGSFSVLAITLDLAVRGRLEEETIKTPAEVKPKLKRISPGINLSQNKILLENTYYLYELSSKDGLQLTKIINKFITDDCLKDSFATNLFIIFLGDRKFTSRDFKVEKAKIIKDRMKEKTLYLQLLPKTAEIPLLAELKVAINDSPETIWSLTIKNKGDKKVIVRAFFPSLAGIKVGDESAENYYFHPAMYISNSPVDSFSKDLPGMGGAGFAGDPDFDLTIYGEAFTIPVMDIYNPCLGGGLYLIVNDLENNYKNFCFQKKDDIRLEIRYFEQELAPREIVRVPKVTLGVHQGDWHQVIDAYKRWCKTWYKTEYHFRAERKWFKNVFTERALETTIEAYDKEKNRLIFDQVAGYSRRRFGGDDIIIDAWLGPIGDYTYFWQPFSRIPGKENVPISRFREEVVEKLHQKGVKVSVYIGGYTVFKDTQLGRRHGEEWQYLKKDGTPYEGYGAINPCPAYPPWQDYLVETCVRIIEETDIDALYIDVVGYLGENFCYNPLHHHKTPAVSLKGEEELLKKLRIAVDKVKPGVAIYHEGPGSDVSSQYADGTHSGGGYGSFTRFFIPHFKVIQIPTFFENLEYVRKSFFNGTGIWFQECPGGKRLIPYTKQGVDLIKKMHRIFKENSDAFNSENPVPLIPTLKEGIIANVFPTRDKILYTLSNEKYSTVGGKILRVPYRKGFHYRDLWNGKNVEMEIVGDECILSFDVGPKDVGCIIGEKEEAK